MRLIVLLCFIVLGLGCGSGEEMKNMGEAANRAAGGDAAGRSGSIDSEVVGGYMPGDINKVDVQPQRNTTATAAGDTYTGVTIATGSGATAIRESLENDPILKMYQRELDSLNSAESRPVARIDALNAALIARIKEIEQAAMKATPSVTVTGNTMVVIAPRNVGKDPPVNTTEDASMAKELVPVIEAAKPK